MEPEWPKAWVVTGVREHLGSALNGASEGVSGGIGDKSLTLKRIPGHSPLTCGGTVLYFLRARNGVALPTE